MRAPRKPQGSSPHAQFLRDACEAIDANRILPGVGYRVKESPSGTVLEIPQRGETPWFHPFRIYRVGSKYQVRGGYVGFRGVNGQYNSPDVTNNQPISGNGESILRVRGGADGVYQDGYCHDFWSTLTDPSPLLTVEDLTLANASDVAVASNLHAATYTLNSDLDGGGQQFASFWVEITDGSNPVAKIKARMWAFSAGATGRPTNPFPTMFGNGSNQTTIVIPIGVITPKNQSSALSASNPLVVEQFYVDHIIDRYAPGVPNTNSMGGTMGPCFWRGEFTEDSLSGGVVFYDGDMVSYDNGGTRELWIHKGIALETGINANFRQMVG